MGKSEMNDSRSGVSLCYFPTRVPIIHHTSLLPHSFIHDLHLTDPLLYLSTHLQHLFDNVMNDNKLGEIRI